MRPIANLAGALECPLYPPLLRAVIMEAYDCSERLMTGPYWVMQILWILGGQVAGVYRTTWKGFGGIQGMGVADSGSA